MHCIVLFLHAVALSLNLNLLFSEWSCILQSSIQLWPALCQRRRSWWRFEYLAQSLQHSFRSLLFHYFSVTTRNSFAGLRHLSSSRIVHFFLLHSVTNYLYPTMSHRQLHQVSNVGYRQHLRSLSSAVLDVPLWPCVQFNCSSCVEQFANGSAVFWVTGHSSTPPENWTVRAFLQLTPHLSNDFTAAWLTFTFPAAFCCGRNLDVYRL